MPAYMFIKTEVTDHEQNLKYVEAAQPLAAKYGRKFLVAEPAGGDAWGSSLQIWFARSPESMADR
jgi:uncharacterized protein (DUF1330 family)